MDVTLNGRTYRAYWKHQPIDGSTVRLRSSSPTLSCRMETICRIAVKNPVTEQYEDISIGRAGQHSGDRFVKEVGRKISLTKALVKLFPYSEDRRLFWLEYFKTTNQQDIAQSISDDIDIDDCENKN